MKLTRNRVLAGAGAIAAATVAGVMLSLSPSGIINTRTGTGFGSDLQAAINAAQTGDVLQLNGSEAVCNCTENKGLVIEGPGTIRTPNTVMALYYPPRTPKATLRNLTVTITIGGVNDIIRHGSQGAEQDSLDEVPQGLTLENVDVTGVAGLATKRGVTANGANLVIRNSKIREIHVLGNGDTQAICGWNGPGPVTVEDSYLESAGENVMFGGADPSIPGLIPSDLTFRRNHFFKRPEWRGVWSVKNLFETKNARRVLIDGNLFENNWTDAQAGFAILFKSDNQDNSCPQCATEDLTFSNNIVRNSDHGINIRGNDLPKASGRTTRIKIINNLWDNIKGMWIQGTDGAADVLIEHNTHLQREGNVMTLYGGTTSGFVVKNNLGARTGFGIKGDATGEGIPALDKFAPGWQYAGNVLAGVSGGYPAGNHYPATLTEVGFVDAASGNYRLAASSPYRGKGTDGKDPGVDWDALNAAHVKPGVSPTPTAQPSPTPTLAPSPTPTLAPSPSPTVAPLPSPTATPTPRPSPSLPACTPNQIIGNPARCLCTTGVRCTGNNARCQ